MRKRLKVSIACDTCRSRKVKCNGEQPVCDSCQKRKDRGISCSYSLSQSVSVSSDTTPDSNDTHHGMLAPNNLGQSPHCETMSTRPRYHRVEAPFQPRLNVSSKPAWMHSTSPPEGADSMTGLVGEPSEGQEFFGSSSAGSFMRQMKTAIDSKLGVPARNTEGYGGTLASRTYSTPNSIFHDADLDYILPSRKVADGLAKGYWDLVYPLYPFIDRISFEEAYQSIWTGSKPSLNERTLICTMNIIFALGSQLSENVKPEQRAETGQMYFSRAQSLLEGYFWDSGSVELVSCFLLMGIYLQSANIPQRCWMIVGHAIRMAQSLGLHLPEGNHDRLVSSREREISRRIWHGCVLMDRVLSMTFGRPAMISKWLSAATPLPLMIDDEFLDVQTKGAPMRRNGQPCMMAFFIAQLQLYDIINDILLELYLSNGEKQQQTTDIITALKLDEALMKWSITLPEQIQVHSQLSHHNSIFERLAIVGRVRFLHARILLFRPILAQLCLPQSSHQLSSTAGLQESLAHQTVIQCSRLCLRAAHEMIELVYTNLDLNTVIGPVPAWWYSILYIYTAATVLLAERLRPIIADGISDYSNAVSWKKAIDILSAYARIGESARRCVAALEILSAKVPWEQQQQHGADETNHHHATTTTHSSTVTAIHDLSSGVGGCESADGEMDFSAINFDLNDVLWLNSMPGNL